MQSLEMPQSPRIRSKVNRVQILVYTSDFSVFLNSLSKIMIQSNAKSLLDITAMLYKQTASSRHDVCLDQRSFKCNIGENCSKFFCIGAKFKF